MTDIDEPIRGKKEAPPSAGHMDRVDMALSATGVTLALFAAFFPWYVFFNHDLFAPHYGNLVQNMRRDLPILSPRSVFSVSPSASININKRPPGGVIEAPKGLDDITTATLAGPEVDGPRQGSEDAAVNQPLPGAAGNFRLLHVAGGRALIEDGSGMYMVGIGEILPDNSKLVSIDLRDGSWSVTTSKGVVFSVN
jgi:hypothetical protein